MSQAPYCLTLRDLPEEHVISFFLGKLEYSVVLRWSLWYYSIFDEISNALITIKCAISVTQNWIRSKQYFRMELKWIRKANFGIFTHVILLPYRKISLGDFFASVGRQKQYYTAAAGVIGKIYLVSKHRWADPIPSFH